MTVEELNSVFVIKSKIEVERQKLETLKLCSESVKPIELSGLPKAKSLTSTTERFATEILSTEQKIIELQNQLVEVAATLAQKLVDALKEQNSLWLSVMIRRFCACMTFGEIGKSLSFTSNYIAKLTNSAARYVTNGAWRPTRRRQGSGR